MSHSISRLSYLVIIVAAIGCGGRSTLTPQLPGSQGTIPFRAESHPNGLSPRHFIALYPVPGFSVPDSITTGLDHNEWFTQSYMPVISRITSEGTITNFSIPSGNHGGSIARGKGKYLWISEGTHLIGRIDTAGNVKEFPLPGSDCSTGGVALGTDGNMWFADRCTRSIGRITPSGGVVEFPISTSEPDALTLGPDGNIWFTDSFSYYVGRISVTGAVTEYPTPGDSPYDITTGPDGNLYAATAHGPDEILQVATSGVMTGYSDAFGLGAIAVTVGPDKKLWLSDNGALLEFDPVSHAFSARVSPPDQVGVNRATAGSDGDVWFTAYSGDFSKFYVGVYEEKITTIGLRLSGEMSIIDPNYGFELGYAIGSGTTTQTVRLSAGESVRFKNYDTSANHTAAFLGNATANSAPWPAAFNGARTQSPANSAIGSTDFSTGTLLPGQTSLTYETGMPGFYMMGCQFHYDSNMMRTVFIVN